jgi:homocysteine S-methyltransferase
MFQPKISINNNPFDRNKVNFRPLILDGAMGSYLQEKGYNPDKVKWMTDINKTNPELILKIHKEYIDAGANIITTNTFRTNPASFGNSGKEWISIVKQAVDLAATAAAEYKNVIIAGSNAPAEDCYQNVRTLNYKKLELNHKDHIDLLIDSGVNFILNETQSHSDEIKIICEHCHKNNIPYIISLYVPESDKILSGEPLHQVLKLIEEYEPLAIGFNCISQNIFEQIREQVLFNFNWGFYLNCGSGKPGDKFISCGVQPEQYLAIVKESIEYKPSFIGSCCGSDPNHIKKIKEFVDGRN